MWVINLHRIGLFRPSKLMEITRTGIFGVFQILASESTWFGHASKNVVAQCYWKKQNVDLISKSIFICLDLIEITMKFSSPFFFHPFMFKSKEKCDFGDYFKKRVTKSDFGNLEVEKMTSWSPCICHDFDPKICNLNYEWILPRETSGIFSEIFRSYFSPENHVSCWKNVILTFLKLGNKRIGTR